MADRRTWDTATSSAAQYTSTGRLRCEVQSRNGGYCSCEDHREERTFWKRLSALLAGQRLCCPAGIHQAAAANSRGVTRPVSRRPRMDFAPASTARSISGSSRMTSM